MKTLVIGGSSLLGRYLTLTKPNDVDLTLTWFTNHIDDAYHLDVCTKSQVYYVLERIKPDVIVHCAAIGSVDYAESHYTETHYVNVKGVENILTACDGIPFVYISTNAIFSGDNPPYSESSETHPINRYGSIKRQAEIAVMSSRRWMVVRPFMLYGYPYPGGRQNWLTTILSKLKNGQEVKLVSDVFWQPTSAEDCAAAIWTLVHLAKWGEIYHVAGNDLVTLYDFGLKIAEIWGFDPALVQPISSSELKGIAPRPVNTAFDLSKIHSLGIELKGIEAGLRGMK